MLDLLLYNGKIASLNKENEIFTSIGITDGKIVFLEKMKTFFLFLLKKK